MMSQPTKAATSAEDAATALRLAPGLHEGVLEQACFWMCALAVCAMVVLTVGEIITRQVFHHSFGISDEFGGYLLVALAFLSLPLCQANGVFHSAEVVQARLSRRARRRSQLVFDVLSLVTVGVLLWYTARLFLQSWESGETSTTEWTIPLWLPRAAMPVGCLAFCITLVRVIAYRLRHPEAAEAPNHGVIAE